MIGIDIKELKHAPEAGPYLIDKDFPTRKQKCAFYCCRMPTYFCSILETILSFIFCFSWCRKTYHIPSDKQIQTIFRTNWPYSALLDSSATSNATGVTAFTLDTRIMNETHPFKGYRVKGLLAHFDSDYKLFKMEIEPCAAKGLPITVTNMDRQWEMCKLFMMQGANCLIKFARHPILHFPQNAFILTFEKSFEENSIIRKLLKPHYEFTLFINDAVIETKGSVLNAHRSTCCCWDAQTFPRKDVSTLLNYGYKKWIGPSFGASHLPPTFQEAYATIETFVRGILNTVPQDAPSRKYEVLSAWVNLLLTHTSYYRFTPEQLTKENIEETVCQLCTDFIFKVSILHSYEHHGVAKVGVYIQPMSIRDFHSTWLQPPCCSWKVVSLGDLFRHSIYNSVFVKWCNNRLYYNTCLDKVQYAFTDPVQQKLVQDMKKNVKLIAQKLELPLSRISKSIEW